MAKQKHGQSDYRSSPSSRSLQPSRYPACPSLSVLSILATITASSQAVDGSPLSLPTPPPSFLCPFIEHEIRAPPPTATTSSSSIATPLSSAIPISNSDNDNDDVQLADKFVQGGDGRWRKASDWTLFGSTCCSTSPDLIVNTSQTTTSSTSMQTELLSVLPAGWGSTNQPVSRTDAIIILSLAIVLAVSICVFMVGCIFWRRRRKKQSRREKRMNDVELTAKRKGKVEYAPEDWNMEKEARGKLHGWAKASARWKANIKHSARQRKNRRQVSAGRLSRPQSPILTEAREVSLPPSSPPSSRRHSMASTCEDFHAASTTHSPENSSTPTQPVPNSPVLSIPRIISSPPAYMFPAPQSNDCPQEASHVNSDGDISCRESMLFGRPDLDPSAPEGDVSYQPNYTGHVAIDDKAHLARLAGLASAPPANEESTGESSLAVQESAPDWHDVLEELHSHSGTIATPLTSPFDNGIPGFPTPPSKSVLSSRYFDGHSYLEDISTLDPIILPSMPPYEAGSSALPFEEVPYASAPPLLDDDQAWESAPEASNGDRNTIPSPSTQPDQVCIGGGGALPIYQP